MEALDDERFIVTDRDEIIRILDVLGGHQARVNAIFNGGSDVLLTAVLFVAANEDAVFLDINANRTTNERLLAARSAQFISSDAGATVKWSVDAVSLSDYDGAPAFRIRLPQSLRRIQRRSAYRITTPRARPVMCRLFLTGGVLLDLPLVDISAEGLGAVLPGESDDRFLPGSRFAGCALDIPDIGKVSFDLLLQSRWNVELTNGQVSPRAGFAFVDMRPATQSMIQRYVNRLERQRIATLPH